MSEMELKETTERFDQGLLKAADRCRELAKMQRQPRWLTVASELDALRAKGMMMIKSKALTRQEALNAADAIVGSKAVN